MIKQWSTCRNLRKATAASSGGWLVMQSSENVKTKLGRLVNDSSNRYLCSKTVCWRGWNKLISAISKQNYFIDYKKEMAKIPAEVHLTVDYVIAKPTHWGYDQNVQQHSPKKQEIHLPSFVSESKNLVAVKILGILDAFSNVIVIPVNQWLTISNWARLYKNSSLNYYEWLKKWFASDCMFLYLYIVNSPISCAK